MPTITLSRILLTSAESSVARRYASSTSISGGPVSALCRPPSTIYIGLVCTMISCAWASLKPRGSASLAMFWRFTSRVPMLASDEINTTTVGLPSSVLPVSMIFTRGDLSASAR